MSSNNAAWITAAKASPLEIKSAPVPTPDDNDVVIQARAVAINPVDGKLQQHAMFPLNYPNILGCDVAGTIHSVGSSVKDFKKGDRVFAHSRQLITNEPSDGAFQELSRYSATLTAKIPDAISFTDACVLPLAIDTAAAGLFEKAFLGLPHPTLNPKPTSTTLLVWGGSSSVGTQTIQLARAAGVEVFTTASKHNHDMCKALGAARVFDHTSNTVVDEIVDALKGKTVAGAYDAIATGGTIEKCAEVLSRAQGNKFVAATLMPPEKLPGDVKSGRIFALTILKNEIAPAIWKNFLPEALEKGVLKPAPRAEVIGKGLEKIQEGMDLNLKGVSGAKVVIEL